MFDRLPRPHHQHLNSTNLLERLNQELKRRTLVVRLFPDDPSCLRLIRARAVATHEDWLEATRYRNRDLLQEHQKQQLRRLEPAASFSTTTSRPGGSDGAQRGGDEYEGYAAVGGRRNSQGRNPAVTCEHRAPGHHLRMPMRQVTIGALTSVVPG